MRVGLLKIREPIWNGRKGEEKISVATFRFNNFDTLWIQVGYENLDGDQPFPTTYIMNKDFFNNYSDPDCGFYDRKGVRLKEFKIKDLQIKEEEKTDE
jgi:hypothetical protein